MTTPLSDAELAEIERRVEAATPGPVRVEDNRSMNGAFWLEVDTPDGVPVSFAEFRPGCGEAEEIGAGGEADATFYAHARTDIPRLLTALAAERAARERLEAVLREWLEDVERNGKHSITIDQRMRAARAALKERGDG